MNRLALYIASAAALSLAAACSHEPQWTVNGTIEGAAGDTLILEASANGRWYPIDTLSTNSSGHFSVSQPAQGYPDIYRLRMADRFLYFPIDSIETVTVTANTETFDTDYTISGSKSAEMMMDVNRHISDAIKANGTAAIANDSTLKHNLSQILLSDPAGIVSYYIISKSIGGMPIFNPAKKADGRIIGAVANAYHNQRPADPRTGYIKALYLSNRPHYTASTDTIQASEIQIIDIDLLDNTGKQQRLSDVAAASHVVLLNFTAYTAEFSPALNVELNRIYEKYKPQGFNIYQVAFDENEYQWRQSAKNLPWTTVYNPVTIGTKYLQLYNVGGLPALYVIKDGALMERITDITKISATVAKYI